MLDIKMHDVWNPGNWLKEVDLQMGRLEKSTAEDVQRDAIALAPKHKPKAGSKYVPGRLKSEIDIRVSRYHKGGWFVMAQGPENYSHFYASFVELGTHAKKTDKQTHEMPEQPYLRPALKKNKGKFLSDIKNAFKGD